MTRIREQLRKGVALALLALAIQFATGLVHVHHDDPGEAAVAAHSGPQSDSHGQPGDDHHAGEGCAFCAVLSLAATSILPEAPGLVLPAIARTKLRPSVPSRIEGTSAALFDARAPPRV